MAPTDFIPDSELDFAPGGPELSAAIYFRWREQLEVNGRDVPISGLNMLGVCADLWAWASMEKEPTALVMRRCARRVLRLVEVLTDMTAQGAIPEAWDED